MAQRYSDGQAGGRIGRPSFSIVAVSLNPGEKLLATVKSVLGQSYGNYEIIVKDGGSVDGSLDRLPVDSRIRLISGKDGGIYDAMNQTLPLLTGQYVLFLNCGDTLCDRDVLRDMASAIESRRKKDLVGGEENRRPPLCIFYGNQYHEKQHSVIYSAPEISDFTCYRNVPCHQVCFYDVRLFQERGYDVRYRVRGDYEHFLYCIYRRGAKAVYVERLISNYEGGGFSEAKENRKQSAKEHAEIAHRYLGRGKALLFQAILFLTLAPLRSRLAENPRWAAFYNRAKTAIYKRRTRGE